MDIKTCEYNPDTDTIIFIVGDGYDISPKNVMKDFADSIENIEESKFVVAPDVFDLVILRNTKKVKRKNGNKSRTR